MEVSIENKKGYKKTKLGWIPDDWKVKRVKEVFDFLKTNSISRSQLNNEEIDEESVYNIHYGDIHTSFNYPLLEISTELKLPKVIDLKTINSRPII